MNGEIFTPHRFPYFRKQTKPRFSKWLHIKIDLWPGSSSRLDNRFNSNNKIFSKKRCYDNNRFNPIRPRLFLGCPGLGGRGRGRKVPAAHNSKSIHGIEIKFVRVVENHKLINLV